MGIRGSSEPEAAELQLLLPCCLANQWIQWLLTLLHWYFPNTAQMNCSVPSRAPDRALYCHELNNPQHLHYLHSNNPAAAIMFSHTLAGTNSCCISCSHTGRQMAKHNLHFTLAGAAQTEGKTWYKITKGRKLMSRGELWKKTITLLYTTLCCTAI